MAKTSRDHITFMKTLSDLSEDETAHVVDSIGRYLTLVKRIYEHVREHNPEILTELQRRARLRKRGEKAHK